MFCKKCGASMTDDQVICTSCGVPVEPVKKSSELGNYDKVTIAIVCFFLGGLGIHNFMLGESKKGILKIVLSLCFCIGCIFALIDFIKILTDTYVVDPEKYI